MGILACHTMKGLSQNMKKVKRTSQKHDEFCAVKIEGRECHLRYGPWITRIPEGQVKRIELEDKGYNDVDKLFQ